MFELILFVILVWFVVHTIIIYIRRLKVRKLADRIISGNQAASEKTIYECFTWLHNTNNWLNGKSEQDGYRVERLSEMRKEMEHPHNQV